MNKKNKISISIREKLKIKFMPNLIEVEDVSEMHRGHNGFKEGGETHFVVYIDSNQFKNKNKLEIHRLINEELKEEWANGVHSISIRTQF